MPLPYISIDNFRAFNEKTEFEFAPITILTGANSSGKSSLVDALRILQNYTEDIPDPEKSDNFWESIFNFKDSNLHSRIPEFSHLINNTTGKDYIGFEFKCKFTGMIELVSVCFEFQNKDEKGYNGILKSLQYKNEEGQVFLILENKKDNIICIEIDYCFFYQKFTEEIKKEIEYYDTILNACTDNNHLTFDSISSKIIKKHTQLHFYHFQQSRTPFISNKYLFPNFTTKLIVEPLLSPFVIFEFGSEYKPLFKTDKIEISKYEKIKTTFKSAEPFYNNPEYYKVKGDIIPKETIKSKKNKKQLNKILFDKININIELLNINKYNNSIRDFLTNPVSAILDDNEDPEYDKYFYSNKENFLFLQKYFIDDNGYSIHYENIITDLGKLFYNKFVYENICNSFKEMNHHLKFNYIPSIRNSPNRFYVKDKEGYFETILSQFIEQNPLANGKIKAFINANLVRFQIGEEITIERHADFAVYSVYISKKGKKVNLLDLGYGILQIMPIMLKIALTANEGKAKTIIVEEPETNLHPALQSKLADMFVEASKLFDIQFVIETHSEYLIRRLQGMVVNKEIECDKIKMYYFHNPEQIPEGEPHVYPINILPDGALSKNFGKGFFDEAANLNIALYNYTKEQHN